jgi:hypothetical protein
MRDTWMMVFGAPKRFCATSQVVDALSEMTVETRRMRMTVVKKSLLNGV